MPSKISELMKLVLASEGQYGKQRVIRAADEIKNLEKMYSEDALRRAFTGPNTQALVTMPPEKFERYAAPIDKRLLLDRSKETFVENLPPMTRQQYIEYLSKVVGGMRDVPYLELSKKEFGNLPYVSGHEGRHRSKAFIENKEPTSLVRIEPRPSISEDLPRSSREDFLEALKNEIGKRPIVRPQIFTEDGQKIQREIEFLPPIYKKGGAVSQDAMHMAVMNQKVQKKAEGSSADDFELKRAMAGSVIPLEAELEAAKRAAMVNPLLARQAARRRGQFVPEEPQMPVEEPQATIKPYDPTFRQKTAGLIERGLRNVSPADRARDIAQGTMGVGGLGVADFVPFIGTGMALQEAKRGIEEARREGKPEEAWAELLGGVAAAAPGIGPTVKMAKPVSKALANEAAYRIYQAVERGEGALAPMLAGVAPKKMIPAWHGSPHDIPMGRSMLMEKIGTGEGAQAYGHGLYAAEGKNVAKSYAAANKGKAAASEGWIDSLPKYKQMDVYNILQKQYPQQVKDAMLEDARPRLGEDVYAKVKERLNRSNLYKLELSHPDPVKEAATPLSPNDFLHWHLPLSEQPKNILNKLGKLAEKDRKQYGEGGGLDYYFTDPDSYSGESIYRYLSEQEGVNKDATDVLKKAGIYGIRYLDAGSRGAGEGTYNYVLFDPKLANIVGKEKKGGVIHKAEGGITSDDLIIEENPL